jgi:hypothetical protein
MDESVMGSCEALQRALHRHREREFLLGVKALRLELMLIAEQARVRELQDGQWARSVAAAAGL